jgi:SpoVK/Ycf46/Vps4 family AAA+-type ATPase
MGKACCKPVLPKRSASTSSCCKPVLPKGPASTSSLTRDTSPENGSLKAPPSSESKIPKIIVEGKIPLEEMEKIQVYIDKCNEKYEFTNIHMKNCEYDQTLQPLKKGLFYLEKLKSILHEKDHTAEIINFIMKTEKLIATFKTRLLHCQKYSKIIVDEYIPSREKKDSLNSLFDNLVMPSKNGSIKNSQKTFNQSKSLKNHLQDKKEPKKLQQGFRSQASHQLHQNSAYNRPQSLKNVNCPIICKNSDSEINKKDPFQFKRAETKVVLDKKIEQPRRVNSHKFLPKIINSTEEIIEACKENEMIFKDFSLMEEVEQILENKKPQFELKSTETKVVLDKKVEQPRKANSHKFLPQIINSTEEIIEAHKENEILFKDLFLVDAVKQIFEDTIIKPHLRPDLYTGLITAPRSILMFSPPGTGLETIAKALTNEIKFDFLSINANDLTNKSAEERKDILLEFDFALLVERGCIFIKNIDAISTKPEDGEIAKKIKTEFLTCMDKVLNNPNSNVIIIAGTSQPQQLNSDLLDKFKRKIYVQPMNNEVRANFIKETISLHENNISDEEFLEISRLTPNYSQSDLKKLCVQAALEPTRDYNTLISVHLRPLYFQDFINAQNIVQGTLEDSFIRQLENFNKKSLAESFI